MARLPQPGGDSGNWGDILNDYLSQALKSDGSIKNDTVNAATIVDGSITETLLSSAVQTKLNAAGGSVDWSTITGKPAVIAAGNDQAAARTAIGAGTSSLILGTTGSTAKAGDYAPTKSDVGLANVDNTSDSTKPVSTATQTALDAARSGTEWGIRQVGNHAIPPQRTFWKNKANTGSPSTIDDTGQTVIYSNNSSEGAFKVAGGVLTISPTTSATSAGYRSWDASVPVTRIGGRFVFNVGSGRTTLNGTVAFIMMNKFINASDPTVRFGAHLVIGPTKWVLQKYDHSTTTFTTLGSGTFINLVQDAVTEYEVDMFRVGNTLTVVLPDGKIITATDTDIGSWSGNFGAIEAYVGNGATDNVVGFTEYWTDTATQYLPHTALLSRQIADDTYTSIVKVNGQGWTTRNANQYGETHYFPAARSFSRVHYEFGTTQSSDCTISLANLSTGSLIAGTSVTVTAGTDHNETVIPPTSPIIIPMDARVIIYITTLGASPGIACNATLIP